MSPGGERSRFIAVSRRWSKFQGYRADIIDIAPCQHTCQRSLFDLDKSLWASWAVQEVKEDGRIGASVSSLHIDISRIDVFPFRYGMLGIQVSHHSPC